MTADFRGGVTRLVYVVPGEAPLPFRRIETPAGEDMQVDFRQGVAVGNDGRRRRPHLFRVTPSFSRKGYSGGLAQLP